MTGSEHHVSGSLTLLFAGLLAAMITCLALEEKIHAKKSIITGTFAILALILGAYFEILPFEGVYVSDPTHLATSEKIELPVYIPAIDWSVIAIILGASLFVDVTSRSGIFSWIAVKLTKLSGGDPVKLLLYYGSMTVIFSAVLNNVTAMIIVGSLTAVSLRKLGQDKMLLGFLMVEGLLTNVGGLLTLISSVPNIIVGTKAGISFMKFLTVSIWYVVLASAFTLWLGMRIFQIQGLKTDEERSEARELVQSFDENDGIESNRMFNISAVALVLFIVAIASTSVLPAHINDLGMGFVALFFAGVMLLFHKHEVDRFYAALDWDLLAFFATLFIVINVMEHAQVLMMMGTGIEKLIALGPKIGAACLLWSSAIASSVTDNIPLAAVLAKILAASGGGTPSSSPLWWAVIFGANLGGNLTPIGSASTVVAVTIIHKNGLPMSFGTFVKTAFPFACSLLVMATFYVLLLSFLA